MQSSVVNVGAVIDARPIGWFQAGIFTLCAAMLFCEGYDLSVTSYAAPSIIRAWHVPVPSFGPVFSAGLVAILFGVLALGPASDHFGRRRIAIGCALVFGLATFAAAFAQGIVTLAVLRFITGLALGGTIPNAYAIAAEYCPRRLLTGVATTMSVGISFGITAGGPIAAFLLPRFGWPAMFYLGGVVPLVLAVALTLWLPESIRFLAAEARAPETIGQLLRRIDPERAVPPDAVFLLREESGRGLTVRNLFSEGRSARTVLAWTMFPANMFTYYFLQSWLPTVFNVMGMSLQRAVLANSVLATAGLIATITMGWVADRFDPRAVLGVLYLFGAVATILIGQTGVMPGFVFVMVACAGWGLLGAQNVSNGVVLGLYPTFLRATGLGWAIGIGRIGAFLSPLLGAVLLSLHWSVPAVFAVIGVPACIAAGAAFGLVAVTRREPAASLEATPGD